MLVLTRRAGESIHLGDDITITILSIKGKQVKLGIDVPEDIPVYRDEIYRRVQEQNKMAVKTVRTELAALAKLWNTAQKK